MTTPRNQLVGLGRMVPVADEISISAGVLDPVFISQSVIESINNTDDMWDLIFIYNRVQKKSAGGSVVDFSFTIYGKDQSPQTHHLLGYKESYDDNDPRRCVTIMKRGEEDY